MLHSSCIVSVMMRSDKPLGKEGSELARSDLMANPTPERRDSSGPLPLQKNTKPPFSSLSCEFSARRVSLSAAISMPYLFSSRETRAVLRSVQSHCPGVCGHSKTQSKNSCISSCCFDCIIEYPDSCSWLPRLRVSKQCLGLLLSPPPQNRGKQCCS